MRMRSYREHNSSSTPGRRSRGLNSDVEENVHSMGFISIVGPDEHGQRMLRSAALGRRHENHQYRGGSHLITLPRQPASFHNASSNSKRTRRKNGTALSILLCFNILFALCGVALLGMGVLVLRDTGRHLLIRLMDPESSLVTQTGGGLLGIGSLTLLTSVLGCTNGLRTTPLSWYIVGVSVVVSGEIGLGVAFLFFNDALNERLEKRVLPHTVPVDYGLNQPFSQSIDFLQHKFKCCGLVGEEEYDESVWRDMDWKGGESGNSWRVPLTCCPLDEELSPAPSYMNPVPVNLTLCQLPTIPNSHRYSEGCLEQLKTWMRSETLTSIGMMLTLLLLQIACLSAAVCVCRKAR